MKFYMDAPSVILRCIVSWITPLIFGFLLWFYESEPSEFDVIGGYKLFLFLFAYMPFTILSIAFSHDALVNYRNRHRPTLEISPTGLRYPYLLNQRIEIPWNKILNIQYCQERVANRYFISIVIEIAKSQYLGKLPSDLQRIQKDYENQAIVIRHTGIAKGYELYELAAILEQWWIKHRAAL